MSGVDTRVPVLVRHEYTELVVRQLNGITIIATRCNLDLELMICADAGHVRIGSDYCRDRG